MDLRIEKTRQSIINAFIALRSGKPLEKITVKELCEKAMINKSTFYFHYADIYELSDFLETEIVTSIISSLDHPEYMVEHPGAFTQELFLAYLSRDTLIQTLFSGSRSGRLIQKIEAGIKELIYLSDKYHDTHASIASRRMINMTGVKYSAHQPKGREIILAV